MIVSIFMLSQQKSVILQRSVTFVTTIILTDFNANSLLFQLHHTEKIYSVDEIDTVEFDYTQNASHIPFSTGELRHKFNFTSAYEHKLGQPDQEASTFQDEWITVDYIFYTRESNNTQDESLKLLGRYKLPSTARCNDMGMVPNLYFGSDHLSLAAKFLIKSEKAKLWDHFILHVWVSSDK